MLNLSLTAGKFFLSKTTRFDVWLVDTTRYGRIFRAGLYNLPAGKNIHSFGAPKTARERLTQPRRKNFTVQVSPNYGKIKISNVFTGDPATSPNMKPLNNKSKFRRAIEATGGRVVVNEAIFLLLFQRAPIFWIEKHVGL